MVHERCFLCFPDSAPVGSVFSACVGHRVTVMLGGLLSSVSMVAGAYSQNLFQLYITVGLLTDAMYALTWTPTVTMLGCYFEKQRPVSIALAGTGDFLFTPFFQFLVDNYSWWGAMLVLGAVQLHCVCGTQLRPLTGITKYQTSVILSIFSSSCPDWPAITFTQLALFRAPYGLVFGTTMTVHITVLKAECSGVS
ncbi:LOW QUALITY PROTEIN: monocarboxylate transporter 13 [Clarias gariepinus]